MIKIVFATNNSHKLKEIKAIMEDDCFFVSSLKEENIDIDIEENGKSFEENALIKARTIWKKIGGLVISDDSGLVIDYLNGEPGIYSSRYMGEYTPYTLKNQKILERMEGVKKEDRKARFVAVNVAILPNGKEIITSATMEGTIATKIEGENGFGYDPILYLEEYSCTSATLSDEEKNKISHRGKALRLMKEKLKSENLSC